MLTLLTVHFSYSPVYILMLIRTICFVMGIPISSSRIGRMQSSVIYNERVTCHKSSSISWFLKSQRVQEYVFWKTWLCPIVLFLHPPIHALITWPGGNHSLTGWTLIAIWKSIVNLIKFDGDVCKIHHLDSYCGLEENVYKALIYWNDKQQYCHK